MAKKQSYSTNPNHIHFRDHETRINGRVRVWREGWGGDQFEVLSREEFNTFAMIAAGLGYIFYVHEDDPHGDDYAVPVVDTSCFKNEVKA